MYVPEIENSLNVFCSPVRQCIQEWRTGELTYSVAPRCARGRLNVVSSKECGAAQLVGNRGTDFQITEERTHFLFEIGTGISLRHVSPPRESSHNHSLCLIVGVIDSELFAFTPRALRKPRGSVPASSFGHFSTFLGSIPHRRFPHRHFSPRAMLSVHLLTFQM